ncbi:MAG: hypothetical protein B7Y45_00305 [Sphingomonas sp. 28-66-16]|nr:MAG: hypothetical protein B7Y45_00305 [Sphingomonas sp. 28-66-16]
MPLTSAPSDDAGADGVRVWHYDGSTAIRHESLLVAEEDHFYLVEAASANEPHDFADLVALDPVGGYPVYGLSGRPGWRIGFFAAPPPALAALLPRPRRYGGVIDRFGLWPFALICAVLAVALLYGLSRAPSLLARLVPPAAERRLGDLMIGDFGDRFCHGPGGRQALDTLAARIGASPEAVDIEVANIPLVNAVTLPGGRVIIFEGLLEDAASADEVAGVLAHELGHVEHRDVLEALLRQLGLSVLLSGLEGNIGGYTNVLLSTAYSRGAETRADSYAIEALNRSHVSPRATAAFFARLGARTERAEPGVLSYLATHPVSKTRSAAFVQGARGHGDYTPALSADQWAALRGICTTDKNVSKAPFHF